MKYLEWSDKFSVNIEELDNQHKNLFGMINTLHDAIISRKTSKAHEDIIKYMMQYAQVHFKTEEEYMKRYEYPFFQNHKTEHNIFSGKALELQERLEKGGFILPLETLNFLRDWWKEHILSSDKKYSKYFKEHGLI